MQLIWKASESTSALYAALCLAEGRTVADSRLAEAFAPAVAHLLTELAIAGVSTNRFLTTLTKISASGVEDNRQLVSQALGKLIGRNTPVDALIGRLGSLIGGLKAAFYNAYRTTTTVDAPNLVDELLLRGRPLVAQWEARGPGLLLQLGRTAEKSLLVENACIVLVYPLVGGNGLAHQAVNAISFEAVLTNPSADLPEVVRLAWLLAQLNLDLPRFADHVSPAHREYTGQLALVPALLSAAEYVELTSFTTESVAQALHAWRIDAAAATTATAETLIT